MTLPEKLWCQSCGLQRETKRQKEKEGKKERKTRIRSFCVEITGPFCWASQLFCLKSLLLPPDCRNRQNISQLFHLRVGKQTMMSALSSFFFFFFLFFFFFICFLFTLFCVCVCQRERRETPTARLPGTGREQQWMSAAGPLSPEPSPGPYKDRPLRVKAEGKENTEGSWGGEIERLTMNWLKNDWREVVLT